MWSGASSPDDVWSRIKSGTAFFVMLCEADAGLFFPGRVALDWIVIRTVAKDFGRLYWVPNNLDTSGHSAPS